MTEQPLDDPWRSTVIGHTGLDLCSPLHPTRFAALVERLVGYVAPLLSDQQGVGMFALAGGKGALARAFADATGTQVVLVDRNPHFLKEARERAQTTGLGALLHIREADVREWVEAGGHQAYGCAAPSGRAAVVACVGARPWGNRAATVQGLRALARPGGVLLIGEGFWRSTPDADFQALLGDPPEEYAVRFHDHARFAGGLELLEAFESTDAESRAYDDHFQNALRAFAAKHPDDDSAAKRLAGVERWSQALDANRAAMGFGWYVYRV